MEEILEKIIRNRVDQKLDRYIQILDGFSLEKKEDNKSYLEMIYKDLFEKEVILYGDYKKKEKIKKKLNNLLS